MLQKNSSFMTPENEKELIKAIKTNENSNTEQKENVLIIPKNSLEKLKNAAKVNSLRNSKSASFLGCTEGSIKKYEIFQRRSLAKVVAFPEIRIKITIERDNSAWNKSLILKAEDLTIETTKNRSNSSCFKKRSKNLSDYFLSEKEIEGSMIRKPTDLSCDFEKWQMSENFANSNHSSSPEKSHDEAEISMRMEDEYLDLWKNHKKLTHLNCNQMININKFTQLPKKQKISIPLGVEPYLKVFLSRQPISDFSDYPMFFGYYFREAYRKAVDDLIKAQTMK
jgi:hypothetical protein